MKLGLSPQEFAKETGLPVYRIRQMVEAGTILADRSTSRITIPRSEIERLRGQPQEPPLDINRLADLVARRVVAELGRLFTGKPNTLR